VSFAVRRSSTPSENRQITPEYDDETLEVLKEEAGVDNRRAAKLMERDLLQKFGLKPKAAVEPQDVSMLKIVHLKSGSARPPPTPIQKERTHATDTLERARRDWRNGRRAT
jgi:hypothetical protein